MAITQSKESMASLDAGSCNLYPGRFDIQKNYVYNGFPHQSGSTWVYVLHEAQVLQPGTVQMTRYHVPNPDHPVPDEFREYYDVFLNLVSNDTKVTWEYADGIVTGTCTSAIGSTTTRNSGVFHGIVGEDNWYPEPSSFSLMGVTGGWFLRSFEMTSLAHRFPESTCFTFKVEKD